MTSRQTITFPDRYYVISPDPRLRAGRITQAIVMAHFQDEHTGLPPTAALNAFTAFPRLTARSTTEGIAGLTGIPERALPKLRTDPYDVDFRVTARRYLPFVTAAHFSNQGAFPDTFTPRDLGLVRLHRESVELFGRVVRATAAGNVPVAGVTCKHHGILAADPHTRIRAARHGAQPRLSPTRRLSESIRRDRTRSPPRLHTYGGRK